MTELEHAARGERHPAGRRGMRWPWLIVGIVLVALKARAWEELGHHPATLIPLLAVALLGSVLRPRPVYIAFFAAVLAAVAVAPHPLVAGFAFAAGAFAVLMVVFMAVATILHARQHRSSSG